MSRLLRALFACVPIAGALPGQTTTPATVTDCAACPIPVREVGRVHDDDGSFRRYNHQIAGIAGGRFVVIPTQFSREPPAIFAYDGRLVGRLGGRGEGPGEVGAITWLSPKDDGNIELISGVRVNEFSSQGQFVGARTLRTFVRATSGTRVGAHFVVNSTALARGSDVNPLYVLGPDGSVVRTIARPEVRAQAAFRAVGPAVDQRENQYWVTERLGLDPTGFTIRRQDLLGRVLLDLRYEPRWFREASREGGAISPVPRFIRETRDGVVIVVVARPKATLDLYLRTRSGHPYDHYESLVLLFAPVGQRVVGSQVVKGFPQAILDDDHIVTSTADADDVPTLVVWRIDRRGISSR